MLFAVAGFEIGLVYTSLITLDGALREVQRLVDDHDKPGVDILLITAGGPDHRGTIYPVEEAVAAFLVEHPAVLPRRPTHIRQIVLHSWTTGRATEMYPKTKPLFGPLYQTLVPTCHPLIVLEEKPRD